MLPFAGYHMPIQYTGVNAEHETVRTKVGVFDVSHMGTFHLKGPKALDLLQKITSNDASVLVNGKVQYSCLPNDKGGIVDDLLVYRLREEHYLLVVNAANIEKDWEWIRQHNDLGVEIEDRSDHTALLAVQGPLAAQALQSLTEIDLAQMPYYSFETGRFAGIDGVLISATGYTGSGGFELYIDHRDAEKAWKAIFEAGKAFGIQPIGLAARDTLRLEMGFCLYGNDLDDHSSPIEAGLGWITKFSKDFVHSEALKAQKEIGPSKKLIGFEMTEKGIPRQGYPIVNKAGETIGTVTSGTMSPSLKKGIGLGYVQPVYSKKDTEICIQIRKKAVAAKVVRPPFYKP